MRGKLWQSNEPEIIETVEPEEIPEVIENPTLTPAGYVEKAAANADFNEKTFKACVIEPGFGNEDPWTEPSEVIEDKK